MLGRKARAKAWRLEERKQQHSAQKQREEDEEREEDERSSYCGYTESEYEEILYSGMKPWDDDACLYTDYDECYDSNYADVCSSPGQPAT